MFKLDKYPARESSTTKIKLKYDLFHFALVTSINDINLISKFLTEFNQLFYYFLHYFYLFKYINKIL